MMLQALDLNVNDIADWPKRMQWVLIALVCTGLFAGVYFVLIQDQQHQLQRLVDEEHHLRDEFEHQQKRAANLTHYRAQLADIQTSFGTMLRQLPDQTEVVGVLVDVSQAGLALGLEFVLFQPQTEVAHTFYAELPIKLHMLGRYHQFGQFVSDLAALPRIVTLHDIVLKPQTTDRQPNDLLLMQATVKTYRYLHGGDAQ